MNKNEEIKKLLLESKQSRLLAENKMRDLQRKEQAKQMQKDTKNDRSMSLGDRLMSMSSTASPASSRSSSPVTSDSDAQSIVDSVFESQTNSLFEFDGSDSETLVGSELSDVSTLVDFDGEGLGPSSGVILKLTEERSEVLSTSSVETGTDITILKEEIFTANSVTTTLDPVVDDGPQITDNDELRQDIEHWMDYSASDLGQKEYPTEEVFVSSFEKEMLSREFDDRDNAGLSRNQSETYSLVPGKRYSNQEEAFSVGYDLSSYNAQEARANAAIMNSHFRDNIEFRLSGKPTLDVKGLSYEEVLKAGTTQGAQELKAEVLNKLSSKNSLKPDLNKGPKL